MRAADLASILRMRYPLAHCHPVGRRKPRLIGIGPIRRYRCRPILVSRSIYRQEPVLPSLLTDATPPLYLPDKMRVSRYLAIENSRPLLSSGFGAPPRRYSVNGWRFRNLRGIRRAHIAHRMVRRHDVGVRIARDILDVTGFRRYTHMHRASEESRAHHRRDPHRRRFSAPFCALSSLRLLYVAQAVP